MLAAFYSVFQMTEAASDAVGPNQYHWGEVTKTLSINSGGGKSNYLRMFFPALTRGDLVEVEFECMNLTSPSGIQVQLQETTARGAASVAIPITVFAVPTTGVWEKKSFRFVHQQQAQSNIYVCIGLFSSDSGHIKLRQVRSRTLSATGVGAGKMLPDTRSAMLVKNSSGWSKRADFVGDDVTISTADANTLQVTFALPMAGKRPIVTLDSQWFSSSFKYVPKASNAQITGFQIQFFDHAGLIVPLGSLTNDLFLGFTALGEKSYFL